MGFFSRIRNLFGGQTNETQTPPEQEQDRLTSDIQEEAVRTASEETGTTRDTSAGTHAEQTETSPSEKDQDTSEREREDGTDLPPGSQADDASGQIPSERTDADRTDRTSVQTEISSSDEPSAASVTPPEKPEEESGAYGSRDATDLQKTSVPGTDAARSESTADDTRAADDRPSVSESDVPGHPEDLSSDLPSGGESRETPEETLPENLSETRMVTPSEPPSEPSSSESLTVTHDRIPEEKDDSTEEKTSEDSVLDETTTGPEHDETTAEPVQDETTTEKVRDETPAAPVQEEKTLFSKLRTFFGGESDRREDTSERADESDEEKFRPADSQTEPSLTSLTETGEAGETERPEETEEPSDRADATVLQKEPVSTGTERSESAADDSRVPDDRPSVPESTVRSDVPGGTEDLSAARETRETSEETRSENLSEPLREAPSATPSEPSSSDALTTQPDTGTAHEEDVREEASSEDSVQEETTEQVQDETPGAPVQEEKTLFSRLRTFFGGESDRTERTSEKNDESLREQSGSAESQTEPSLTSLTETVEAGETERPDETKETGTPEETEEPSDRADATVQQKEPVSTGTESSESTADDTRVPDDHPSVSEDSVQSDEPGHTEDPSSGFSSRGESQETSEESLSETLSDTLTIQSATITAQKGDVRGEGTSEDSVREEKTEQVQDETQAAPVQEEKTLFSKLRTFFGGESDRTEETSERADESLKEKFRPADSQTEPSLTSLTETGEAGETEPAEASGTAEETEDSSERADAAVLQKESVPTGTERSESTADDTRVPDDRPSVSESTCESDVPDQTEDIASLKAPQGTPEETRSETLSETLQEASSETPSEPSSSDTVQEEKDVTADTDETSAASARKETAAEPVQEEQTLFSRIRTFFGGQSDRTKEPSETAAQQSEADGTERSSQAGSPEGGLPDEHAETAERSGDTQSAAEGTSRPSGDAAADAMTLRLREAPPRLSAWLAIILDGVEEKGDLLYQRLAYLLKALDAPDDEAAQFIDEFRTWLDRMEYTYIEEFRSELQYRLALALELEDEEDERNRFLLKIQQGLSRTREQLSQKLDSLFAEHGSFDDAFWENLEELFITADLGYETSLELVDRLRNRVRTTHATRPEELRGLLQAELAEIFRIPPHITAYNPPEVVLMVGVNGVGKTTTIGKLAHRARMQGRKVLIAAADTFRAAAIEQLEVWAERSGALFFAKPQGSDPASVAYEAMDMALRNDIDLLFIDTAGRLQTKVNLMEELKKIRGVIGKKHAGAPHRTVLVIDATTGQNALSQVKLFKEAAKVDELIVTKLDGTAKGGFAIALALQFGIPISYIGLGEKMEDLRPFRGEDFANALIGDATRT